MTLGVEGFQLNAAEKMREVTDIPEQFGNPGFNQSSVKVHASVYCICCDNGIL